MSTLLRVDASIRLDGSVSRALADSAGRVVGINTAVAGIGLGLAVPINAATRHVIAALMSEGHVRRAYLGIAGGSRPLPPGARAGRSASTGVEVVEVVPGSPAERGGIRPEDLIVEVEGEPVAGVDDLQRLMVADLIGVRVTTLLIRHGREIAVELVPVELSI